MDVYTFDYNGVEVQYLPATVATRQTKKRIIRLLLAAYGYPDGNRTPPDEWDTFEEYSDYVSRSKADAPWWMSSASTTEQARAAFEAWRSEPEELYDSFLLAHHATTLEKKVTTT